MLKIAEYDRNTNYRTLKNDERVFHEALKNVLRGEKRFHVEDSFDLIYHDNDHLTKHDPSFPDSDFYRSEIIFPPYYSYDENDTDKLFTHLLEGYDEVFFEEANEYSAVIASLLSRNTDTHISFKDGRIRLFPWIGDKAAVREEPEGKNVLYVQKDFYALYTDRNRMCTLGLFHSLFILQWLTDLPLDKIKYLSFSIRKTEGIGSILSVYSRLSEAFGRKNIRVFIEPGCTRFSDKLLSKYFVFGSVPKDSDEHNTAYAECFNSLILNPLIDQCETGIRLEMLQPEFVSQMKEYADQIISDKKVLGVLLRGTDYVVANFAGSYHPADIEDCLRIIGERIDEYSYDRIFVATEDSYFLERMIMAFPKHILAVSQERHTVAEVKDVRYLSELEKKQYSGDAYSASVEDTTVNYFYAMYMLSRCESFISNCMCSGVNIVESFNDGKFVRSEIISDLLRE